MKILEIYIQKSENEKCLIIIRNYDNYIENFKVGDEQELEIELDL
jgi:hypothetical protein